MDQETKQAFENLTLLVQQGFSKHDEEFAKVHQNLKKHDDRFKKNDDVFAKIHASLKKHDDDFVKVHASLKKHDDDFVKVHASLKKHDDDIESLAMMTQRSFDEAREENQIEHAKINQKIENLIKNTDAFLHIYQKVDVELTITQHNCQELDKRVTVLETTKA